MIRPFPGRWLALCLFSLCGLAAAAPPLRIMPLGDSITDGVGASGGYRGDLYNSLTAAGYSVDMVGNQRDNSEGLLDKDHEGHPGWRIDQLDSNIEDWLSSIQDPDFVLIHIGTNDFGQGYATSTSINRLDALILHIATLRPSANIVVTNLMVRGEPYNTQIQAQFNPYVQGVVAAHAAAGRKVTFLDMRAAVPLSDMPDQLHPNAAGYVKMSNAYLGAIQAIATPEGDHSTPGVSRAAGLSSGTQVTVTFTKPVADAAAAVGNFTIPGLTISSATLDASKRVVTLTTSPQTPDTLYTVAVSSAVTDRLTPAVALPAGSSATFSGGTPRGYASHVPEAGDYTLACSMDIPATPLYGATGPVYKIDNRAALSPFDRVAYYVELQGRDGKLQYVWASMDAFTTDGMQLGVPVASKFQQGVANLSVISNVAGVTNGSGLQGNLEFWPNSYTTANSASVPGASGTLYDAGDSPQTGLYGSMQLHNTAAGQTVFAYNHWALALPDGYADLGIGNDPAPVSNGVDWTNHHNAAGYTVKSLQVLVRTRNDHTAPQIASATASASGTQVVVDFTEPLAAASVDARDFTLSGGVSVLAAQLTPDQRRVILTTSTLPVATQLSLAVTGVRDNSANANVIAAGAVVNVAPADLPAEIQANVGAAAAGYQLVYSADIGVTGNFNAGNAYRYDDHLATSTFSKVAYYLELQTAGGPTKYVWASMDPFSAGRAHLGLPTLASGASIQSNVTNLQVISNVAGVTNGATATGGNIEFWPYNYDTGNSLSISGASGGVYDTGDVINTGGRYGSMQIHNHATNQTVMAINHFGEDGNVLDIGIGNNPAPVTGATDWTFAANAGSYTKRKLHVLVLPGQSADPTLVARVPEAANYQLAYSLNIPATGNLRSGAGFVPYAMGDGGGAASFSRVAYYMELQKTGDATPSYVWVSMDPFTTNGGQTGVPTSWIFQKKVTHMNVVSNVSGVVNGTDIATGNIEFWPGNYVQNNDVVIPNGSSATYDFGDGSPSLASGYGSMQVHNYGAQQTIFALNGWGSVGGTTNKLCVGIGNCPNPVTGGVDWTFSENAATYNVKRLLQVYVLPAATDTTAPALAKATGTASLDRVDLTFSEPISEMAVTEASISIPGLTVTGIERMGPKDLLVHTTAQTPGASYTVTAGNIRDRSPAANTAATTTASFTAYAAPAAFANVPEISSYRHIRSLALPALAPHYNTNGVTYNFDETGYGEFHFDRVAYLMELDGRWAYASFDAPVSKLAQTGVPAIGVMPNPLQGLVTHMNVASNAAGIVTGNDIATGSIEFWAGNYDTANGVLIPGASDTTFDYGDVMTSGAYGTMQIHNYGAGQTIMAFNDWGDNADNTDLGIGNNPSPVNNGVDWTFSHNAASYAKRNLYVLVRPASSPEDAPLLLSQPGSQSAGAGGGAVFAISASGPNLSYQWRHSGIAIPGATQPWLDLSNVSAADAGTYDVVVTGPSGVSTVSATAALTVAPTGPVKPSEIVRNANGSIGLVFYADASTAYQVQRSATLNGTDWTTLDTRTSDSQGRIDYTDLTPPSPKAFYRVVKAP